MSPIRIQRKRTKGWKMPKNTIYVGRGTEWAERAEQRSNDAYQASNNETKHTSTPWRFEEATPGFREPCSYGAKDYMLIAPNLICPGIVWDFGDEGRANAAFIVKAVNCHDELVAALKQVALAFWGNSDLITKDRTLGLNADEVEAISLTRAALAKERGQS